LHWRFAMEEVVGGVRHEREGADRHRVDLMRGIAGLVIRPPACASRPPAQKRPNEVWIEKAVLIEFLTPEIAPSYVAMFGTVGMATLDARLRQLEAPDPDC
jgi:hypothetical protein